MGDSVPHLLRPLVAPSQEFFLEFLVVKSFCPDAPSTNTTPSKALARDGRSSPRREAVPSLTPRPSSRGPPSSTFEIDRRCPDGLENQRPSPASRAAATLTAQRQLRAVENLNSPDSLTGLCTQEGRRTLFQPP